MLNPCTKPWKGWIIPGCLVLALGPALVPGSASAAEFSGICPVLGETQPQPPLPAPLAVPQQPIEVTVQGKTYPICSVYMSVAESGTLVPPDIFPVVPPNDINFPDLLTTPWYLAPGNNASDGAKAFAEALIATAEWQANGESDWLLNPNTSGNPNDSSMESAYFLWRDAKGQFDKGESVFLKKESASVWSIQTSNQLDPNARYWYWVVDAPIGPEEVPGPLPLAGVAVALGWSRRLRRRLASIN
jgi:hypothetical protein